MTPSRFYQDPIAKTTTFGALVVDKNCDFRKYARMSEVYLDPAASLAVKLGGLENLASAAGVSLSRASRYRQSKDKGGTGGLIPSSRQQRILDWAQQHGVKLGPADFFAVSNSRDRCVA